MFRLLCQCRNVAKSQRYMRLTSTISNGPAVNVDKFATSSPKVVSRWLYSSAALVFGIVVVGGLTRLTESGLSMVDWKLLGRRPPRTHEEWIAEFNKYKHYPEFKINNRDMTLGDFKRIFWYEYTHRQIGRCIGVFFAVPALYFIARRRVNSSLRNRLLLIGGLIGGQGLLGWYMVKSGLDESIVVNNQQPRVSQYRLAAHLCSAFVIYSLMLTTGMRVSALRKPVVLSNNTAHLGNKVPRLLHPWGTTTVTGLVFATAASGAFVAGLDAGLIYNEFPLMGGRWIPSDIWDETLGYKNIFENVTTVQWDHRVMATLTTSTIIALFALSRRYRLPPSVRVGFNALLGMTAVQVTLGITTLLYHVPIPLASAHQAGSLSLLTISLWTLQQMKKVK